MGQKEERSRIDRLGRRLIRRMDRKETVSQPGLNNRTCGTGVGFSSINDLIEEQAPSGNLALVIGGIGSGKTVFTLQFLCEGLIKEGRIGLLVSFNNDKRDLFDYANDFGWHLKRFDKNETIKVLARVSSSNNGMKTVRKIKEIAKNVDADRIALDGLEVFSQRFRSEKEFEKGLNFLKRELRGHKCITIMTSKRHFYFQGFMDAIFTLHQYNSKFGRTRELEIMKGRGNAKKGRVPFKITDKGILFENKGLYMRDQIN